MSIWKNKNWPRFHWSLEALLPLMLEIRRKQGELTARGFSPHENIYQALTQEQLFAWKAQTSLPEKDYRSFPVPMAPQPEYLKAEMNRFLRWFNSDDILKIDGALRAGIAHLWFVTIHPFDDGNQRVASLISDRALAQDEKINFRRESLSASILKEKRSYDDILARTQNGDLEITPWLQWFFNTYLQSLTNCEAKAERNLQTVEYWLRWKDHSLNDRQRRALQALLEFDAEEEQELTNKKYVSLTETSPESAKRDLADLLEKDILIRNPGAGRSTSYSLKSN
jgi:Fic family protein